MLIGKILILSKLIQHPSRRTNTHPPPPPPPGSPPLSARPACPTTRRISARTCSAKTDYPPKTSSISGSRSGEAEISGPPQSLSRSRASAGSPSPTPTRQLLRTDLSLPK